MIVLSYDDRLIDITWRYLNKMERVVHEAKKNPKDKDNNTFNCQFVEMRC